MEIEDYQKLMIEKLVELGLLPQDMTLEKFLDKPSKSEDLDKSV